MPEETENKVGRPEFVAGEELCERVERYVAFGMTQQEIARTIGCSIPTLVKHFSDNIENGLARKLAAHIDKAFESTKDGMVKYCIERMLLTAGATLPKGDNKEEETVVRPAKLGKKEQAKVDATHAGVGTEWEKDFADMRIN